jgi:cytochrome c oxidase subunit 3
VELPQLQEQFETPAQQKEVSTLGMWIFLVTEVMFFGGLFLAYAIYRREFAAVFGLASNSMDVWMGAANTAVLICSSFTMVLAVRSAQIGSRKALIVFLILTIVVGGVFLGISRCTSR